jgi:Peptidase family M28
MKHTNANITVLLVAGMASLFLSCGRTAAKADAPSRERPGAAAPQAGDPIFPLDDAHYLRWPLPASAKQYAAIDGDRMKRDVEHLTRIAGRSRDDGHQWWGRITGTPYHDETQRWIADRFRQLGLDVHLQEVTLPDAWFANAWQSSAISDGRTIPLKSVHPVLRSPGTPATGLDLEPVYVGLGSAAELLGRDLKNKAVFLHSLPMPGALSLAARSSGAIARVQQQGPAAIFIVVGIPGNFETQVWGDGDEEQTPEPLPTFSIGLDEGNAVRQLIEQGHPVKIHVKLDIEIRHNVKTAAVHGVLAGTTDEQIVVMAHGDGFFQGAIDNASGVAAMLGLAEYSSRLPKAQRRRTITFLAPIGHHVTRDYGLEWMRDNMKAFWAKTALIINSEHVATTQTYFYDRGLRTSTTLAAHRFFVGRSKRIGGLMLDACSLFGVALNSVANVRPGGDLHYLMDLAPGIEVIESNTFYHSDHDDLAIVPAAGLEAMTRAYAKLIDDANRFDLNELVDPPKAVRNTPEPLFTLDDDTYLRWPLPATQQPYARLDGAHMKKAVRDLTAISARSKADGNQWWGRITGTPYHEQTQDLIATRFQQLGLEVRRQEFDVPGGWYPQTWKMTASGGGRTIELRTAQPVLRSSGTPGAGLTLEPVYLGMGSPAEFAGRDVRGKLAVLYSWPTPSALSHSAGWSGATTRAQAAGAAAVAIVLGIPGNFTTQLWGTVPEGQLEPVPTFSLGSDDGATLRQMIESHASPKVHIAMSVEVKPHVKSSAVWGVLPGTSDENVMVMAHSDAFFQGAVDNASGVGVMLGLAEYYAALPKSARRRTMTFMSPVGHHVTHDVSLTWMHDHMTDVWARTALILNCEHVATTQTFFYRNDLRRSTGPAAHRFFVARSGRLGDLLVKASLLFGVGLYGDPGLRPSGDLNQLKDVAPGIELIESNTFYHSDMDEDTVPAAGLEAVARAYARVIDDVNTLNLADIVDRPSAAVAAR